MTSIRLRSLVLLFCLLFQSPECLVMRKRFPNPDEFVSDRQLLHAVDIINLAASQRHFLNEDTLPNSDSDLSDMDLLDNLRDSQNVFEQNTENDEPYTEANKSQKDENRIGRGYIKDTEDDLQSSNESVDKRLVNKAELEEIFEQPQATERHKNADTSKKEIQQKSSPAKEQLIKTQIMKLLDETDEVTESTPTEISKIIVSNLNHSKIDFGEEKDLTSGSNAIGGEMVAAVEQAHASNERDTLKLKRSALPAIRDTYNLENNAVEMLRAYIQQQDDQNHHLLRALNLATLAQDEQKNEYVADEMEEIKDAARNEQFLQALRNAVDDQVSKAREVEQESSVYEKPEEAIKEGSEAKREGSVGLAPSGWSLETDDGTSIETIPHDNNDKVIDEFLQNKLKQYLQEYSSSGMISANDDEEPRPSYDKFSEDREDFRYALNPFRRDIQDLYKKTATQTLEDFNKQGVCEPAEQLVDDCLVARQHGLTLDDEALDLCNQHQLCYQCGSYYELSPDSCDRGYMEKVMRVCSETHGDQTACDSQALGLYSIITNEHSFMLSASRPRYECTAPCIHDILGDIPI